MKKKLLSVFLCAGLCMSLITGCSAKSGSGSSDSEVFKIGAIGPFTGGAAAYGNAVCNAAELAVEEDMPLLENFVHMGFEAYGELVYSDGELAYVELPSSAWAYRTIINYFAEDAPTNTFEYNTIRDKVLDELDMYRDSVAGMDSDVAKIECVGKLYDANAVYDLDAPYHGVYAIT